VDLEDGFRRVISLMKMRECCSDILVGENLDGLGCDKKVYCEQRQSINLRKLSKYFLTMKTITFDFDSPLTAKIQSGNKLKQIIDNT